MTIDESTYCEYNADEKNKIKDSTDIAFDVIKDTINNDDIFYVDDSRRTLFTYADEYKHKNRYIQWRILPGGKVESLLILGDNIKDRHPIFDALELSQNDVHFINSKFKSQSTDDPIAKQKYERTAIIKEYTEQPQRRFVPNQPTASNCCIQ
jgi:hypothetical protein